MPLWAIQLIAGLIFAVASTYIQQARQAEKKQPASGYHQISQVGGDQPKSFIVGTFGSAGKIEYEATYGTFGDTPNAYYVLVLSFGDLPITEFQRLWVNKSEVTVNQDEVSDRGYVVPEYEDENRDHLWWWFQNGTQTTALDYLVDALGDASNRPWTSSMVGRNIPHLVLTSRMNRLLYAGFPDFIAQFRGVPLYDVRQDSTAGGSGTQRANDQSTWQWSDNPICFIYTTMLGFRRNGEWFWGRRIPISQARLPYAEWAAAMDRCDDLVPKKVGGTEKRYRMGREILVSERPVDVIREVMVGCNTKMNEDAGVYHIQTDIRETTDFSFSDDDIIKSESAELDAFPAADDWVNGALATYLEPEQAWTVKDARPYLNATFAAQDGETYTENFSLHTVFSGTQAQRVEQLKVLDSRRAKKHIITMRPQFRHYRPLQIAAWTSAHNQYSAKKYEIIAKTVDYKTGCVMFAVREMDPEDNDWDPETDEQDIVKESLNPFIPDAQPMQGWDVDASSYTNPSGGLWKPTFIVSYAGLLPDVASVRIEVRESWGSKNVVFQGLEAYDQSESDPSSLIEADFIPGKTYEFRGKFVTYSGRRTLWSNQDEDGTEGAWLSETALVVPSIPPNSVTNAELEKKWRDAVQWIVDGGPGTLLEQMERGVQNLSGLITDNIMTADRDIREVSSEAADAAAAVRDELLAVTDPNGTSALAQAIRDVAAESASGLAEGLFTIQAYTGSPGSIPAGFPAIDVPNYVAVRLALLGRASNLDSYKDAGMYIDIMPNGVGGFTSSINMKADSFNFLEDDGGPMAPAFTYDNGRLTLATAYVQELIAVVMRNQSGSSFINLKTGALRLSTG